jgi:2-amino-4-hydroxy-6-hydroxymethyldihydropteridine diphosphokinase
MPATARGSAGRHRVLLGLGANLGDPVAQIWGAIASLGEFVRVAAISSLYRTDPIGMLEQPVFYNLVVSGRTGMTPFELLSGVARIEAEFGRTRGTRDGPRTIDIDILAFDQVVIESPHLTLPHPRMHERAFVLVPLVEIEPLWSHPVSGMTATELLGRLRGRHGVERLGGLPELGY